MALRFIFGDDIFVSYSRQDAIKYAEGLASELARKGYSCRIDQWESEPGQEMPGSLLRALTRASMLVIVGTRGAAASPHVGKEIDLFVRRKRPVIPIDVGGAIPQATWYPIIQGLVLEREGRADALDLGQPSPSVLSRIEGAFTYRRRNVRIQRVFRWTLAGIFAGLVALGAVLHRANSAQGDLRRANEELGEARGTLKSTERDLDGKVEKLKQAQGEIEQAKINLADTQRSVAVAQAEAERQGLVARSRALASTAETLLSQRAFFLPRSALLAIESVKRYPTIEGDQALRRALALMPMPLERLVHGGPISQIAYSRDGRLLATAGTSGITLLEVATGQRRRLEPGSPFSFLSFTSDGRRIVAAAGTRVHIWDVDSGGHRQIEARGVIQDLAISPDGQVLAFADQTPEAGVWRIDGAVEVLKLPHQDRLLRDPVRNVAFDPTGRYLATGWRSSVMLWDAKSWTLLRPPIQFNGGLRDLGVSPGGEWIAVATPLALQIVDSRKADSTALTLHPAGMLALSFHPDGKRIAGGMDGTARIWDMERAQQLAAIAFQGGLGDLAFSPDGRFLAVATTAGVATLWDATSERTLHMVHGTGRTRIAFDASGPRIATAAAGEPATAIWGSENGQPIATIPSSSPVTYSADGRYLTSAGGAIDLVDRRLTVPVKVGRVVSADGRMAAVDDGEAALVWDLVAGRAVFRLEHWPPIDWDALSKQEVPPGLSRIRPRQISEAKTEGSVRTVALSHDARYALTARIDGRLRLWEVARGAVIAEGPFDIGGLQDGYPVRAAFSRNAAALAIGHGRRLEIWHPADVGRREVVDAGEEDDFRFDGQGAHLAIKSSRGIRVYAVGRRLEKVADVKTGDVLETLLFGHAGQFASDAERQTPRIDAKRWQRDPARAAVAAFRPGQRWLARARKEGVEIHDLRTLAVVGTFPHETEVGSVALSPGGRFLATASAGTVRIWETANGAEVSRIEDGGIDPLFSPDGRLLATTASGRARVWAWQPADLITEACARVTRNLTCAEWAQYIRDARYGATCRALPVDACR
jgi:WD40 repeat protein